MRTNYEKAKEGYICFVDMNYLDYMIQLTRLRILQSERIRPYLEHDLDLHLQREEFSLPIAAQYFQEAKADLLES